MVWDKLRILEAIRRLHKEGRDISYNALARRKQSLVSAAAYHFGSFRAAVEKAGVEYASVLRRPRWTKQKIINLIKSAKRSGDDLHWSSVTKRRDELGRAAFAALQPRLFGSWDRALHGAGLDADEVSQYRRWDRNTIAFAIKGHASEHQPLNSGAIQKEDPSLHAAAVRHFGSYDAALKAAGIKPMKVRQRHSWTREEILSALKKRARLRKRLSDSAVRQEEAALYGAAVRLFGSFTKARDAAKLTLKRKPAK